MHEILIVEDERAIADALEYMLRVEGFATHWVQRGGEALARMRASPASLVILDVGLPDISGFEACRQLRRFSDVPVLFLTARGDEVDRIVGLEIGADDYVVKPFSPREVAARVRAILKRAAHHVAQHTTAAPGTPATTTDASPDSAVRVDAARRQVTYRGQLLALTPHEYRLLEALVREPERVWSREQLLDALGIAPEAGYERNVDGHVRSVRAKLRAVFADGDPIQTHRGFGYSYQPGRC